MFKLGTFTDEISQDLEHACKVAVEFGVDGAELRGVWNTPCEKFTDAQVQDIKRIVGDCGMVVCSIGSPFGKCELGNPEEVATHMDHLRRCSDFALELGCNLIRGFAFWGHGAREKPWDKMLKAYEPVPAILEEKGTILALENEASCYVGTAGHTRTFLDMLGCERVKAVWDPANHVHDPDGLDVPTYPDGYDLVKDDIVHMHVKDAAPGPDGKVKGVFMGAGLCHWREQFQALKDDGYAGHCSLETHVRPDSFPKEFTERYGQYLTGEDREAASKVCLAWIRDCIAGLE